MAPIRLLLVDHHAMFREGLRLILERQPDMQVVGEAGDALMALQQVQETKPDVVLMDLLLPQCGGLEATRRILAQQPAVKVIALTMCQDSDLILAMIEAGARAYVLKDLRSVELVQTIREVAAGRTMMHPEVAGPLVDKIRRRVNRKPKTLTERELQVLRLVVAGDTNREIATKLAVSEQGIKNRLYGIYKKLGVTNRTGAAMVAVREGLVESST
jgi:DNA-binding NarL/FixJ family response regulator